MWVRLPLMAVEAVPVFEDLLAELASDWVLNAVHRLEVASVHTTHNHSLTNRAHYSLLGRVTPVNNKTEHYNQIPLRT